MFTSVFEFCKKWVSILNKCAADLMLFVIDKSIEVVELLKTDWIKCLKLH